MIRDDINKATEQVDANGISNNVAKAIAKTSNDWLYARYTNDAAMLAAYDRGSS